MNKILSVEVFKVAILYGSKFVGAVSGFIFMPVYLGLMGAEDFSFVVIIASLQAVVIILDFGVLTKISRDLAVAGEALKQKLQVLLKAEGALTMVYVVGGLALIAGLSLRDWSYLKVPMYAGVLVLLLGVVLQALHGAALIALSRFFEGALCNTFALLLRAIGAWGVVKYISPSIESFVIAQAVFSIIGALVSRRFSMRHLRQDDSATLRRENFSVPNCIGTIKKSRALMVSSLVGAAATQLDKTILLGNISAQELSAYFLAHSISSMPLAIVATPIVQYFQPKVVALHDQARSPVAVAVLRRFAISIVLSMTLVGLLFGFFGHTLIAWWLTDKEIARLVMDYADLLVVAYLVAGVGYIPYVMMIAAQGYAFNAKLAVFAAGCLVSAVVFAAFWSSAEMACLAFIGYYGIVTSGLFFRMHRN